MQHVTANATTHSSSYHTPPSCPWTDAQRHCLHRRGCVCKCDQGNICRGWQQLHIHQSRAALLPEIELFQPKQQRLNSWQTSPHAYVKVVGRLKLEIKSCQIWSNGKVELYVTSSIMSTFAPDLTIFANWHLFLSPPESDLTRFCWSPPLWRV